MKKIIRDLFHPATFLSGMWSVLFAAFSNYFYIRAKLSHDQSILVFCIFLFFSFIGFNLLLRKILIPSIRNIQKIQLHLLILASALLSTSIVAFTKINTFSIRDNVVFNSLLSGSNIFLGSFSLFVIFSQLNNNSKNDEKKILITDRIIRFSNHISPIWVNILFILLCVVVATLEIGNFKGRLGNITRDDGPSVYAYYYAHPERYKNDIITTYGEQQVFATLQNFLPAMLYRFVNISPDIPSILLTYLQYILLGLAVRRFSKKIIPNELTGWLSALFVFAANPGSWNLADYGNAMYIPYAGHLVIPFILFSFSDIVEEKNKRAMLWLFIGGLIHPTLTLYAIGMVGIYWISKLQFKKNIVSWIFLLLVTLSAVLPRMLVQTGFSDGLLSFEEMKSALLSNQHLTLMNLNYRALSFLFFLGLIILSLRDRKYANANFIRMLLSVFLGCVFLTFVAWLGWKFEILEIIQFIAQRSTNILVYISIPLVTIYFYRNLSERNWSLKLVTLIILCLMIMKYTFERPIISAPKFFLLLILLLLLDLLPVLNRISFIKRHGNNRPIPDSLSNPNQNQPTLLSPNSFVYLMLICLLFFTFRNSWAVGAKTWTKEAQDAYDIQVWARHNTPEDAMIVNMSRAVSQRASVNTIPYNWFVYNRSKDCKSYVDRYIGFYAPYFAEKNVTKYSQVKFDSVAIVNFAHEFKADYILSSTADPYELSEVYRNSNYVLYAVPPN